MEPCKGHRLDRLPGARRAWLTALCKAAALAGLWPAASAQPPPAPEPDRVEFALPAPKVQGPVPFERTLAQRRSRRSFAAAPLTLAEAGQLLWAAQGISDENNRRTAPSAGATYPLVLYLVAGQVDEVAAGVYRYLPQGHRLAAVQRGDRRAAIATAAYFQIWMREAPAYVLIAAQPSRTEARYGQRAERYVAMEAGAAAQNLLLQAVALGLGATLVGAFNETALKSIVPLPADEQVLAIIPVGRP